MYEEFNVGDQVGIATFFNSHLLGYSVVKKNKVRITIQNKSGSVRRVYSIKTGRERDINNTYFLSIPLSSKILPVDITNQLILKEQFDTRLNNLWNGIRYATNIRDIESIEQNLIEVKSLILKGNLS